MFRKPRHASSATATPTLPCIGRPPTPPSLSTCCPNIVNVQMAPLPLLGRSQTTVKSSGRQSTTLLKSKGKGNSSILSFFKKTESPQKSEKHDKAKDGELFLQDNTGRQSYEEPSQAPTSPGEGAIIELSDDNSARYNENLGAVKRRRTSGKGPTIPGYCETESTLENSADVRKVVEKEAINPVTAVASLLTPKSVQDETILNGTPSTRDQRSLQISGAGPFIEDDDSEDETTERLMKEVFGKRKRSPNKSPILSILPTKDDPLTVAAEDFSDIPPLKRESTSIVDLDEFDGIEDFIDDEFPAEGEEYMERQWMDDQERIDFGLEGVDMDDEYSVQDKENIKDYTPGKVSESQADLCPICSASLEGIAPEVGSVSSQYQLFIHY